MAELLDDFDGQPAEDPAAEFLKREQGMLAEFGEDELALGGDQSQGAEAQEVQLPVEPAQPADPYAAISVQDTREGEPEPIRKWKIEQEQLLGQKDQQAEEELQQWRQKAQQQLTDFYARQAEELAKVKEENRTAEEAFIRERDEDTPGCEWERVGRMCEFSTKNSKNTKDVARLRGILLHLKQTPLVR